MGVSTISAYMAADLFEGFGAFFRQVVSLLAVLASATAVRLLWQSVAVDVVQLPELGVRRLQPLKFVEIARWL